MSKKEILFIIIAGVVVSFLTIGIMYIILKPHNSNDSNNQSDRQKDIVKTKIKVGNYIVKFGNYVGVEEEYNPDTDKVETKKVYLELSDKRINNEKYVIDGTKIITDKKLEYEVIGNNKIRLLAGGGIEYEYQG